MRRWCQQFQLGFSLEDNCRSVVSSVGNGPSIEITVYTWYALLLTKLNTYTNFADHETSRPAFRLDVTNVGSFHLVQSVDDKAY